MLFEIIKYAFYAVLIVACLVILITAFRGGKPLKTILWSGIFGVISLIAVAVAGHFTVPMLNINSWSLLCSFALGVPGVLLMLIIHKIWYL